MEMKSLGITGNIGTGKSSVLNILKNKGIKTFDLDNVAKNLYKSNTSINKKVLDVFPSVSSTENQINTKKLGNTLIILGGGRLKVEDKIDYSVGIKLKIEKGDYVEKSQPICTLYASNHQTLEIAEKEINYSFEIGHTKENINSDIILENFE